MVVTNESNKTAHEVIIRQNYPNPFNAATTINYTLLKPDMVILKIYNLNGEELETLVNTYQTAGSHKIKWKPNDLASGLYLYALQVGAIKEISKLTYLK